MEFSLPRSALPHNSVQRRQLLDEYFPHGLIPYDHATENGWMVSSFVPKNLDFHVDPLLGKTLENWPEVVPVDRIGYYQRFYQNSMVSFFDSWSLYYWSLLINWLSSKNELPDKVTILHIDDHKDLESPLISLTDGGYECIFTNERVQFEDPASIKQAIIQKSIGIGSFLTPLLHSVSSVDILHLKYSHQGKPKEYALDCTFTQDQLLAIGRSRPDVIFQESNTSHHYKIARDPIDLIHKDSRHPLVLFHIDCDAFSNRFNCDSSWHTKKSSIDMHLNQMMTKINELFSLVAESGAQRVFLNVALSPGFFPSEYWEPVLKHIFSKAEDFGIIAEDDFSIYLKQNYPQEVIDGKFFP